LAVSTRNKEVGQTGAGSLFGILARAPDIHTNDHAPTLEVAKAEFDASWQQWLRWANLRESL
jgi:hypothetical protein